MRTPSRGPSRRSLFSSEIASDGSRRSTTRPTRAPATRFVATELASRGGRAGGGEGKGGLGGGAGAQAERRGWRAGWAHPPRPPRRSAKVPKSHTAGGAQKHRAARRQAAAGLHLSSPLLTSSHPFAPLRATHSTPCARLSAPSPRPPRTLSGLLPALAPPSHLSHPCAGLEPRL